MSYTLNTAAAREGDTQNLRITETGAYVGAFTKAEKITSTKGTTGIEFSFVSREKQSADFLTLWTVNKDGEQIYGFKQLMALMTCMRVKDVSEKQGTVEKFENGQKVKVAATIHPELMGKPIGVLLQKEEYEKNNGQIGHKFNLAGFFDPQTRMTATEILDKAGSADKLDKMIAALKDKPLQKRAAANYGAPAGEPAPIPADDDDIPW
jgi:hypothetical protein